MIRQSFYAPLVFLCLLASIALTQLYFNSSRPSSSFRISSIPASLVCNNTNQESEESFDYQSSYVAYTPASVEEYILNHTAELGYDSSANPSGCEIFTDKTTKNPVYDELQEFVEELDTYANRIKNFEPMETDIRDLLKDYPSSRQQICERLQVHPDGLSAIFPTHHMSFTKAGYVEPLLPILRHPRFCWTGRRQQLMDMGYMIHDFAEMCRQLRPNARTVFVDMGASLDFHAGMQSPAMYILDLYRKFGFHFDHVYAFEITKMDATNVYEKVPKYLMPSYHWINVGVDADPNSKLNPLHSIIARYSPNDFVVVKLDVDTSSVEVPLANQLLNNSTFYNTVDHFYFEHHVRLKELAPYWGGSMKGTIEESLNLFRGLRERGVAAHYWP